MQSKQDSSCTTSGKWWLRSVKLQIKLCMNLWIRSLCSNWSNLTEQFSSCLNNKHTGLSEVDSALSIDVTWTWCQWRMLHSKQRSRSRYYKSLYFSISLNVSSLLLFSLPVNCFFICYWVMLIQQYLVLQSPAGMGCEWRDSGFLRIATSTAVTWGSGLRKEKARAFEGRT